jgi:glycosyltransferase involved in cell wall biosynthesis
MSSPAPHSDADLINPETHARVDLGMAPDTAPRSFRDWASWWLHIPDRKVGWLLPAIRQGLLQARLRRPDVIFSSAPLFTSHLVAMCLQQLLGARWLADFRDPWTDNAWRQIPYAAHRRLDAFLERRVVSAADRISTAYDSIREQMAAAFPAAADKMSTVLNGFDPDRIDAVPARSFPGGCCTLVHAGTFYGPRSPLPLLEALKLLRDRHGDLSGKLRVILIGPIQYEGMSLSDLADKYQVRSMVEVLPSLPHRQALAYVKGADAAILFCQCGRQEAAVVPMKTYEYVGAGKGVLAVDPGPEVCRIVRQGGCTLWQTTQESASVAQGIETILEQFRKEPLRAQANQQQRNDFTRTKMVRDLAQLVRRTACRK